MARSEDVYSNYPEKLVIGAGETAEITAMAGQNAVTIKWSEGGSLSITGTSMIGGCSFAVANEYLLDTTEIVNQNLSGVINLTATGATVTAYVLRYKTAGA